jgi:4-hydroxy-tetrahydrodipicolinate synthase
MVNSAQAKAWAFKNIRGLWASPMTPFDDELKLYPAGMTANVEHLLRLGVSGMGYGHSEPWVMSLAERKLSTEHFLQAVNGRVPTYAHTHDHSAPHTVELTKHAADSGATLVMIDPPFEHAKTDEQILRYYDFVAERTDIGIIVLNTPHSGRLMSPELIRRLTEYDAVCALKNGINDFALTVAVHRQVADRIVFSHPREDEAMLCLQYLKQQVKLGSSAVYLLQFPDWRPLNRYTELAESGDLDGAWKVFEAIGPLRSLWNEIYATLWGSRVEHPIAATKCWMEAMGMYGGPIRPPMLGLTEGEKQHLTRRVKETFEKVRADPALADVGGRRTADRQPVGAARL